MKQINKYSNIQIIRNLKIRKLIGNKFDLLSKSWKLEIGNYSQSESGFTLIEVLVSAAIMVILGVAFLGLQYILSENQTSAWKNYLSIESANGAVSTFTKELRSANQSETGSYPLEVANDQEIIFYSDYDYDGVAERVRYTLSGTDLMKGIIEPTGDPLTYNLASESVRNLTNIIRNGTDPMFYYYNSDWPSDTTNNPLTLTYRISDTREIKLILSVNPNTDDNNYILEGSVKVRMLN